MAEPGDGTDDIRDQKTEGKEGSPQRHPGELTEENIEGQRDAVNRATNANRKSVSSLERGVEGDETGEEEMWEKAKQEAQINHSNQEDFDDNTKEEIDKAENIKEELEDSGNYSRIDDDSAINLNADLEERNQEWVDTFSNRTEGEPVSMADSLDHIETTAMRWGAGAEDQGLYKGIFDAHFQETGDRNKSAAQSADEMSDFRSTWENHHRNEFENLSGDLTQLFDEVNLTPRDSEAASGELSIVENLEKRVAQYQDVKEAAEESIENYKEAKSEKDPEDVTEDGLSHIRELKEEAADHLENQEDIDPGKAEFEPSEKEREVKKTWTATKLASLESVEQTLHEAETQKDNYESLKENVSERKETYTSLVEDVELTNLEEIGEGTEDVLNELDFDTVLDLATLSDGDDIISQLDDGPRSDGHQLGSNNISDQEAAEKIVDQAYKQVYGEEDETGLIHEYGPDSVDDKLAKEMDGEVTDDQLQLLQLQGMYAKAEETADVLREFEERLGSEISDYETAIGKIEDAVEGYDSLDEFTGEERTEAINQLNDYLPEDEKVSA